MREVLSEAEQSELREYAARLRKMPTEDIVTEWLWHDDALHQIGEELAGGNCDEEVGAFLAYQVADHRRRRDACDDEMQRRRKAGTLPAGGAVTAITPELIREIKEHVDLRELVEGYGVALKQRGREFVGLCPFHDDRDPSLCVDTAKGVWHCHGCQAGGDAISFVMRRDSMDFITALRELAVYAGVELPRRNGGRVRPAKGEESSNGTREARATIRSGLDAGAKEPRDIPGKGHAPKVKTEIPQAAPRDSQSRFKLFSADDALDPQPPIEWIVEGVFSAGSVSVVCGEGGSKKTWSMLDCSVAVAHGEKWLNFATRRSTVLIVDEESGERRLKRRLGNVLRGHAVGKGEVSIICTSLSGLKLLEADEQTALLNLTQETGAKFIVIDALIDILIGGDENKSADVQSVFHALRCIAETTGAAIVVIHHNNRAGGYRGSSAMQGAIDLLLSVESKVDSPNIDFASEKPRDVESFKFAAIANFGEGTFNLSPSAPSEKAERLSKSERYVLDFLAKGDAPMSAIISHADACSAESARRSVYRLVERGKVERRNPGARGAEAVFGLVGRQEAVKVTGEIDFSTHFQRSG